MSMTAGVVGKPIAALLARVAQILERRDGCWFRDVTRFGLAAITYFNNGRDISGRCKRNASPPELRTLSAPKVAYVVRMYVKDRARGKVSCCVTREPASPQGGECLLRKPRKVPL